MTFNIKINGIIWKYIKNAFQKTYDMLGGKKNDFQSLFWLKYEPHGLNRVKNPKNPLKCLEGCVGGSKLVLDINKNKNNISLGCGCWATGHSSRVAMIWCQYIGSTVVRWTKNWNVCCAQTAEKAYIWVNLLGICTPGGLSTWVTTGLAIKSPLWRNTRTVNTRDK